MLFSYIMQYNYIKVQIISVFQISALRALITSNEIVVYLQSQLTFNYLTSRERLIL